MMHYNTSSQYSAETGLTVKNCECRKAGKEVIALIWMMLTQGHTSEASIAHEIPK